VWSGEEIINNVLLGLFRPGSTRYDTGSLIQAALFITAFYAKRGTSQQAYRSRTYRLSTPNSGPSL